MKIIRVGDPHIRPNNLEEAERLMQFIYSLCEGAPTDRLEILGDLFHTHAVVRLEVLEFWNHWLQKFSELIETVVLVGNHDMIGDHNSGLHALNVFKRIKNGRLHIIDKPTKIGLYGYLPYIHDTGDFVSSAQQLAQQGSKILVCHATFYGSQFDNGFYAPEGISPNSVPFDTIISGHIHKEQIIAGGKVDYPGTPKWDTASDANEKKGVWLYEHDDANGAVINRYLISTAEVCTPIVALTWLEGQEQPEIPAGSKASIELVGSGDWISKKKAILKGKASIKSKSTDQKRTAERKAGNSLENYLRTLYTTNIDRQELLDFAKEIGIV